MKTLHLVFIYLAVTSLCLSSALAGKVLNDSLATKPFNHHIWQDVLNQYVTSDGEVDLVKLRANPKRLNQYLTQLENVSPEIAPDYFPDRNYTLAYWINAHNAVALRLILDAYPVANLEQIPNYEQNRRYKIGNRGYSLWMMKRKISFFNRPMALLALSDYSFNTPPVLKTPYEGPNLETQLAAQTDRIMQAVGYQNDSDCVAVTLPPVLNRYGAFFMAGSSAEFSNSEDVLDLPLADLSRQNTSTGRKWANVLFPYAPPNIRAELRKPCEHAVDITPDNQALRLIAP